MRNQVLIESKSGHSSKLTTPSVSEDVSQSSSSWSPKRRSPQPFKFDFENKENSDPSYSTIVNTTQPKISSDRMKTADDSGLGHSIHWSNSSNKSQTPSLMSMDLSNRLFNHQIDSFDSSMSAFSTPMNLSKQTKSTVWRPYLD